MTTSKMNNRGMRSLLTRSIPCLIPFVTTTWVTKIKVTAHAAGTVAEVENCLKYSAAAWLPP